MSEPAPRAERKTPPTPIPFTVLTGFLGAGKTTLLNRLLKDPALAETAVVINEFGEVGLDHLLVEYVSDNMVLLQSGCLCCTMRGDLVDALETLLRDLDNRRCTFKRLLLETTGLADPAPVLHTAMSHPYLVLRYRLDGVITVADAAAGESTLDAHVEAVKQAAVADRIVLTKTDLVDEAKRQRIVARLRALNPAATILDAANGEATADRLLGSGLYDPDRKIPDVKKWLAAEAYADSHGHHHHHQRRQSARRAYKLVCTHSRRCHPVGNSGDVSRTVACHARRKASAHQRHRETCRNAGHAGRRAWRAAHIPPDRAA